MTARFMRGLTRALCVVAMLALGTAFVLRPRSLPANAARYALPGADASASDAGRASPFERGKTFAFDTIAFDHTSVLVGDAPVSVPGGTSIALAGWILDWRTRKPASRLTIRVDGGPSRAVADDHRLRPDVAAATRDPDAGHSGFLATIPASQLGRGIHRITLTVIGPAHDAEPSPPIVIDVGPLTHR